LQNLKNFGKTLKYFCEFCVSQQSWNEFRRKLYTGGLQEHVLYSIADYIVPTVWGGQGLCLVLKKTASIVGHYMIYASSLLGRNHQQTILTVWFWATGQVPYAVHISL
jgi:hypothetical protein